MHFKNDKEAVQNTASFKICNQSLHVTDHERGKVLFPVDLDYTNSSL